MKQENERRTLMMCADPSTVASLTKQIATQPVRSRESASYERCFPGPVIGVGAPILPLSSSSHPIHVQQHNAPIGMLGPPSKPPSRAGDAMVNSAELDESEGIWA
ncbi:unnamed protein product, partial [Mesorhabditis spiculigera]